MAPNSGGVADERRTSIFGYRMFSVLSVATIASNIGTNVQTMSAAWLMSTLTASPTMVALVYTASSLPVMLFALIAGAMADNHGPRTQMLRAQLSALILAAVLALIACTERLGPGLLLLFTLLIGIASAFYFPAWQASMSRLVPRDMLPMAVTINAIGFNLARCAGPAAGGFILSVSGAPAAFLFNAATFAILFLALLCWRQERAPQTAEPMLSSLRLGVAYMARHPAMRVVLVWCAVYGIGSSVIFAFLPLTARRLLGGGVHGYSLALMTFGLGAIAAGLIMPRLRAHLSNGARATAGCTMTAIAIFAIGLEPSRFAALACIFFAGMSWVISFTTFNVAVQLCAPHWLVGRAIAAYQSVIFAGFAIGSALWGLIARSLDIYPTFLIAGVILGLATWLLSVQHGLPDNAASAADDPQPLPPRAPGLDMCRDKSRLLTEIIYKVDHARTLPFLAAMHELGALRRQLGVSRWMLHRDIDDPQLWTESFCTSRGSDDRMRAWPATRESADLRAAVLALTIDKGRHVRRAILVRDDSLIDGASR